MPKAKTKTSIKNISDLNLKRKPRPDETVFIGTKTLQRHIVLATIAKTEEEALSKINEGRDCTEVHHGHVYTSRSVKMSSRTFK